MPEELLKLKAEAGAAPPGFSVESEPVVTAPSGWCIQHTKQNLNTLIPTSWTGIVLFSNSAICCFYP